MNNAVKSIGSKVIGMVVVTLLLVQVSIPFTVTAAELKTYNLPVSYINKYSDFPTIGENSMNKVNINVTISTDIIKKGTVITLSGMPNDCINFQENDKYAVTITEDDVITANYGGWYDGLEYDNSFISYVVQTDEPTLTISFGTWQMKYLSGMDAKYIINPDCSINEE